MKSFVRFKIDTNSIETDVLEQLEKSQKHTLEEASVELEVFTQHTDKNLVLLKNEAINYQVASYDISDLSVAIEELDKQYSVQVKEAEALWSEHYDLCQEKINAPSDLHAEYDEKINAVVKKHREKEAEANETKRQLDILKGKKAIAELNQATIKRQSAVNVATFSSYYKEYLNLDAKLESLRLHTPVNYLRKDGVIKGFNADGDLVVIFDSYGNYHALSYDKRTVGGEKRTYITGIVDQNERQTVFNYNANLQLTSIITPNGDRTEYEYSAEKLSRILYSDGTTLKLITSAKTVTQIKSSEKQYAAVLYAVSEDTGYKVSNVTVYSEVEVISHNSTVENTLSVSKTTLTYDENKTTITDAYDNQEIYIFDTNPDCLKEFYTVIDGKVAAAERYTYSDYDYDLDFSIVESANENLLNCFDYTQFVSLADDSTNAPFDKFARVDYDKYRRAIREETTWKHSVISAAKPCVITHHTYDDAHHLIKSVSEVYHLAKNPPTYTTVTTYQYNDKGSVIRSESYVDGRQLTEGITIEEHEYDDKGREVRTFSYNTLDASSKFYTEREYDEDGKLVAEPDATGKHKTSYRYAAGDGKLLGEILPNGSEFAYGYDEAGRVTAITHSTEDGEENANNTAYTYGCATEVKSGNNVVRYTYDGKRRITAVDLNGVENYVTYAYEDVTVDGKKAEKVTATMKDGSTSVVIKDLNGNTLSTILGGETVNYTYDNKNRLTAISGRLDGSSEEFTFDALDNLSSYVYNNGSKDVASESYAYNANRQLASKTVDGKTYTYTYKDDTAKSLESVSVGTLGFAPKLDCLGRNKGKTISFITKNEDDSETWTKIAEEQITYLKFGDHATNIPATVYYGDKKNGSYAFSDHFKYKYDSMGNITEIRENGELYAKYTYDTIGRLVREDNKKLGKTSVFTYDTNGNILCRKEYPFTLTDNLDELASTTFAYTYDSDKLLSYNGEECTYDAIGNPEKYRGLDADFDNGRQLKQLGDTTFTYDNLGRRISKKIPKDDGTTETITFTYDANGNLIRQSDGISFIYDGSGVCGICYGNSTYFYRKDILGNIVALLNADGEIVAKYTYDAWGNHTVTATEGNETIANLNPFRYRSYYYDVETGLYFLKTRYYDPETGRFTTIDDISYLDPESINGLNLYAYCRNNPIMLTDRYGCAALWEWLIAGVTVAALIVGSVLTAGTLAGAVFAGAALGAGMSLGTQALRGELSWGQFFLDTGVGAITGLIGGSGVSRSVATILGGVIGAVSNLASQLIEGTSWSNISVMQILIAGAFGALSSYIGGAGARNRDAINEGKGVQKAIAQLNKVVRRIANGTRYKSLTTAQAAFTNAMNGLTGAIQSQMSAMFATAMISYGVSTVVFSGIDAWFDEDKYWLF